MSGDGGNPPSLRDLLGAYEKSGLGKIGDVLSVVREGVEFDSPIEAIEAFTTVAVTFLIVPPKELQEVFIDAFSELQVNQL
jgi:hypothetical protein